MPRLLVVDDEPLLGRTLTRVLAKWELVHVESPAEAIQALASSDFDGILCDWQIGPASGLEVWRHVEAHHPALATSFAFMTGSSPHDHPDVESLGPPVLRKPFSTQELLAVLDSLTRS